jgi:hypothetical protein
MLLFSSLCLDKVKDDPVASLFVSYCQVHVQLFNFIIRLPRLTKQWPFNVYIDIFYLMNPPIQKFIK